MSYVEAHATGAAAGFVQAFWQSTGVFAAHATHRVLPDACADFIFDLSEPSRATRDCAEMVGTMTRAIVVAVQGRRDTFGIRFRPGAAWLLWRAPMRALCDGRAELDAVVPGGSSLAERLSERDGFAARVALAQRWIAEHVVVAEIDREKLTTVAAINRRLEAGSTALGALGWNERKLQRFFEAAYGTNPATMRCFWRFEHLRRVLLSAPAPHLAELAIDHGYSDQSHMAREFQRFSGLSISDWRAEIAAV